MLWSVKSSIPKLVYYCSETNLHYQKVYDILNEPITTHKDVCLLYKDRWAVSYWYWHKINYFFCSRRRSSTMIRSLFKLFEQYYLYSCTQTSDGFVDVCVNKNELCIQECQSNVIWAMHCVIYSFLWVVTYVNTYEISPLII